MHKPIASLALASVLLSTVGAALAANGGQLRFQGALTNPTCMASAEPVGTNDPTPMLVHRCAARAVQATGQAQVLNLVSGEARLIGAAQAHRNTGASPMPQLISLGAQDLRVYQFEYQ